LFPSHDPDASKFDSFVNENEWQYKYIESSRGKVSGAHLVCSDDTIINLTVYTYSEEHHVDVKFIGFTRTAVDNVKKIFLKYFDELLPNEKGNVKMLISGLGGVELHSIGSCHQDLIPENYKPNIVKEFDKVVENFNSKDPFGRIVLLSGPPGTGKSYFVRALLDKLNTLNLFVPMSIIGNISGPGIIGAVSGHRDQENQSILLIVEDADDAIKKREGGNQVVLSDILNFADGLLGQLADIKIIATTNAEKQDIDDALLRPGRMFANIQFEPFTLEEATKIFHDKGGKPGTVIEHEGKNVTIAEIYAALKNHTVSKKKAVTSGQYL